MADTERSGNSSEAQPQSWYSFGKTQEFIRGEEFKAGGLGNAIVIGDSVSLRYLNGECQVGFARVQDGQIVQQESVEKMDLFGRYCFETIDGSLKVTMRAFVRKKRIRFTIDPHGSKIMFASKAGIKFQ